MIHQLQRQWCIWPQTSHLHPQQTNQARRWDKIIGLIPQQHCLFKQIQYQTDLIARSDIESCLLSELEKLSPWSEYQHYYWVEKLGDYWQISVWFWPLDIAQFAQPVTHCLPALAYYLACMPPNGVLIYSELANQSVHHELEPASLSWAVPLLGPRRIDQLYPLHSRIHQQAMEQKLRQQAPVVLANQPHPLCPIDQPQASLKSRPAGFALAAGKRTSQLDLDNPWQYWPSMLILLVCMGLYMALDASLLGYRQQQLNQEMQALQQSNQDLLQLRNQYQDQQQFLSAFYFAQAQAKAPAQLLDWLTAALPADVVVEQWTYRPDRLLLQGSVRNTVELLESLSNLPATEQARLLGETTQQEDGRQVFRAEIQLKEVSQWH